jgi:hypothetical protein
VPALLWTSHQNQLKKEVKDMWNVPSNERLARIPKLYETENVPLKDKMIHLHFFIGGCDWYIAEYDGTDLFWGFACLNDLQNAEWGYISFSEMEDIRINGWLEIDCELEDFWKIRPASEIELIRKANDWPMHIPQRQAAKSYDLVIRPA